MDISGNLFSQTIYKSTIVMPKQVITDDIVEDTEQAAPEVDDINTDNLRASSLQSAIYDDIKAAIYNYSHPKTSNITSSYGTDFDSICNKLGISPTSTITKSDLTKKTINDSFEDENSDFFGALNRAFSYLGPDDTISYNDVMLFFMRGVGFESRTDNVLNFNEYKQVVNTYSDIVEQQYQACSSYQEKLEFIIDKTRDYLKESRMDMQLDALERLTVTTAGNNIPNPENPSQYTNEVYPQVASVGQIAFANLGGWNEQGYITGGAYSSWLAGEDERYGSSDVNMWAGDEDASWSDGTNNYWADNGITLNTELYFKTNPHTGELSKWYEIVGTLVHELTHATAYYYYDVDANGYSSFSQRGLDFMVSKGVISSGTYSTINQSPELKYLVETMWDEWAAYSTSCNYWDSIAGDVFNSSDDLAVSGTAEYDAIKNHLITTGYDYQADNNSTLTGVDGLYHDGMYHERPIPNISYENLSKMFYFA